MQQPLVVEFEGKKWSAGYRVDRGMVQVRSIYGDRTWPVVDAPAQRVAEQLYLELLQGAKVRGWLE